MSQPENRGNQGQRLYYKSPLQSGHKGYSARPAPTINVASISGISRNPYNNEKRKEAPLPSQRDQGQTAQLSQAPRLSRAPHMPSAPPTNLQGNLPALQFQPGRAESRGPFGPNPYKTTPLGVSMAPSLGANKVGPASSSNPRPTALDLPFQSPLLPRTHRPQRSLAPQLHSQNPIVSHVKAAIMSKIAPSFHGKTFTSVQAMHGTTSAARVEADSRDEAPQPIVDVPLAIASQSTKSNKIFKTSLVNTLSIESRSNIIPQEKTPQRSRKEEATAPKPTAHIDREAFAVTLQENYHVTPGKRGGAPMQPKLATAVITVPVAYPRNLPNKAPIKSPPASERPRSTPKKKSLPSFLVNVTKEMEAWHSRMKSTGSRVLEITPDEVLFVTDHLAQAWQDDFVQVSPEHTHAALRILKSLLGGYRLGFRIETVGIAKLTAIFREVAHIHPSYFEGDPSYIAAHQSSMDGFAETFQRAFPKELASVVDGELAAMLSAVQSSLGNAHPKVESFMQFIRNTVKKCILCPITVNLAQSLIDSLTKEFSFAHLQIFYFALRNSSIRPSDIDRLTHALFARLWDLFVSQDKGVMFFDAPEDIALPLDFVQSNNTDERSISAASKELSYTIEGLRLIPHFRFRTSGIETRAPVRLESAAFRGVPFIGALAGFGQMWDYMLHGQFLSYMQPLLDELWLLLDALYSAGKLERQTDEPRATDEQRTSKSAQQTATLSFALALISSVLENDAWTRLPPAFCTGFLACSAAVLEFCSLRAASVAGDLRPSLERIASSLQRFYDDIEKLAPGSETEGDANDALCIKFCAFFSLHRFLPRAGDEPFCSGEIEILVSKIPLLAQRQTFHFLFGTVGLQLYKRLTADHSAVSEEEAKELLVLKGAMLGAVPKLIEYAVPRDAYTALVKFPLLSLVDLAELGSATQLANEASEKKNDPLLRAPLYATLALLKNSGATGLTEWLDSAVDDAHCAFLKAVALSIDFLARAPRLCQKKQTPVKKSPVQKRKRDKAQRQEHDAAQLLEDAQACLQELVFFYGRRKALASSVQTALLGALRAAVENGITVRVDPIKGLFHAGVRDPDESLRKAIASSPLTLDSAIFPEIYGLCIETAQKTPELAPTALQTLSRALEKNESALHVKLVIDIIRLAAGTRNVHARSAAHFALKAIMDKLQCTLPSLFRRHPPAFVQLLQNSAPRIERCIEDLANADFSEILVEVADFVLPFAIQHKDDKLLTLIATRLEISKAELCHRHYAAICASALCPVLTCADSTHTQSVEEVLQHIDSIAGKKIPVAAYLAESEKFVVEQLISLAADCEHRSYADVKQAATEGLVALQQSVAKYKRLPSKPLSHEDSVAATLSRHAFGILDEICGKLGVGREEISGARLATQHAMASGFASLRLLLDLLGHSVSTVLQKVQLLKPSEFSESCQPDLARCWHALVTNLPPESLQKKGRDLLVDFVGFCNFSLWEDSATYRDTVLAAIRHIVQHAGGADLDCFSDLFPQSEALAQIFSKGKQRPLHTKKSLQATLSNCIEALQSESAQSRLLYLRSAYARFCQRKLELRSLPRATLAPFVGALLHATRDTAAIADYAARCLGLVGAIAPSQLSVRIDNAHKSVPMEDLLHPLNLSSYILQNQLLRLLHSTSDAKMHDRAAFAIQSLIRICSEMDSVSLSELDAKKSPWWNGLSADVRAQLRVFVQTTYEVKVVHNRDQRVPEYARGMPFGAWLCRWFINLCARTTGVYAQVFQSLRNVAKRDTGLCVFLFPYLVHMLVVYCEDTDAADIHKEIAAVLDNADVAKEHAQMLFDLIDTLQRWSEREESRFETQAKAPRGDSVEHKRIASAKKKHTRVSEFLEKIQLPMCIEAAHSIKAPARAVLYAETYVRHLRAGKAHHSASPAKAFSAAPMHWCAPADVRLLQKVYAELMEPDGIIGLSALRSHTTEEERALDFESSGKWQDALQCNELLLQRDPQNLCYQSSLMTCMRNLGQFNMLHSFASAAAAATVSEEDRNVLRDFAIQGAWRLSKWDTLEQLGDEAPQSFDGSLARVMLSMHTVAADTLGKVPKVATKTEGTLQKASADIEATIRGVRTSLLPAISAASMESYERTYPYLLQLHILSDLEQTLSSVQDISGLREAQRSRAQPLDRLAEHLAQSRAIVEITPMYQEPVLATHRAILGILGKTSETAPIWMQYGTTLRNFGMLPSALSAFMQASAVSAHRSLDEGRAVLAHAKILYARGDRREAIALLEGARETLKSLSGTAEGRQLLCKSLLRIARWNIDTNQKTPQEVEAYFTDIISLQPSEKAYFHLGSFIESVYAATLAHLDAKHASAGTSPEDLERRVLRHYDLYIPKMLASYGHALCNGHRTVYKTLLKFLTRWLDTAHILHLHITRSTTNSKRNIALAQNVLKNTHAQVDDVLERIPPYIFMTALPQLVSRIGHRDEQALERVRSIIERVILEYPQQALWYVYFVVNSTSGPEGLSRARVMKEILHNVGKASASVAKLTAELGELIHGLIAIASQPVSSQRGSALTLAKVAGFRAKFPTGVLLPTQQMLHVQLPHGAVTGSASLFGAAATIEAIEPEITVIQSLQKPKRITMRSSAGTTHHFLCKAKDETRKDSRMMEYSAMINRLLSKTPSGKLRKLGIRTFTVLPLSEDSGIIEWVPNLLTLRTIVDGLYGKSRHGLSTAQLKEIKDRAEAQKVPKSVMFTQHILPHFPPVLHRWFAEQFAVPSQWFDARTAFTRTCAVMSVVGHIVGLGDRHGENLLIDTATGECVHVDFACLFDKGELLEVPERVRFRLTQNIVDAFGVTGVEGVFRKACEIALETQMENRDTLMGILETFVHDPLVEWSRKQDKMDSRVILHRVEKRLKGYPDLYGNQNMPALNVEGVVQKLISSTTSVENLSQMYYWWMPWL